MGEFDVGPYRIIDRLGSGGMGDVFLAHDGRLGRKVAIKAVSTERAGSADARRRLLLEARAAATLNHPGIAAIYDVLEQADQAYIVMEYVRGETLAARVRRGAVPVPDVMHIGLQLADALEAAHDAGIVHRDLKCDNVVLTDAGRVKVLDFGLAKVGDQSTDPGPGAPADAPRLRGTPPYMSPEQLAGQRVDRRADLYSLGVVLFELLTGRRPYEARTVPALSEVVQSGRAPDVRTLNPDVPAALAGVIARALERHPNDRYQTARALGSDLARLARGRSEDLPTASMEAAAPGRRWGRVLRRPALTLVALAAVAVVLWAWFGASAVRDASARPSVLAILAPAMPGGDAFDQNLGMGIASTLETRLSRVPGLTVVALSSSVPFCDKPIRVRQVGKELGANLVLTVRAARATQGFTAALSVADAPTERVVWAEEYGPHGDLADLQRQLALGVANALALRLSPRERDRLSENPTADRDAMAEFTQARGYLERRDVPGNLQRAVDLLQRALGRDPKFALAHSGLAETYWRLWEETHEARYTDLAQEAATEALRLDPGLPAVHYTLGVIYRGRGRTADAIEELQKSIELQPEADDPRRVLGEILASAGKLDEGVAHFERAIELRPGYWDNYRALGRAYFDAGRYADAIAVFRRATELQPDNARGYQMLGTAYQLSGDRAKALANYRRSLELQPNARAWSNIGLLQYQAREFPEAVKAFEQAVILEPALAAHRRNLGDAFARVGRQEEARAAYGECLRLLAQSLQVNAKDADLLSQVAVVEAKLGRALDAERDAADAVALAPSSARVRYRQAVARALIGRHESALQSLAEAVRLGYSREEARADDDLAALRVVNGYRDVLGATD